MAKNDSKSLELVYKVWQDLREHFETNDRSESIETVVSVLSDSGHSSQDIHDVFQNDPEFDRIVSLFFEEDVNDEEDDPDNLDDYFFNPEEDDY
jgi:hypothetical protein